MAMLQLLKNSFSPLFKSNIRKELYKEFLYISSKITVNTSQQETK